MAGKTEKKELLVAILPKTSALDILKTESWYHIPVESAPKRWPSKGLAKAIVEAYNSLEMK